MRRRDVLQGLPAGALAAVLPDAVNASSGPLPPVPATEDIPVAFLLSDSVVVIDFAGPWEVFQDVSVPGRAKPNPFRLYTVAETAAPIRASGGLVVMPTYTLASAPLPKVLCIPAQAAPSAAVIAWVRQVARTADLTMSVCTGAFLLARTGLLDGRTVATHHGAYAELAIDFPDVTVRRGARFVDSGTIASSGGLSSGIDLALHVVARYFGTGVAAATADTMEYQGTGWMDADSNRRYVKRRASTSQHPSCAVCEMAVDRRTAPSLVYRRTTYLFCGEPHRELFKTHPDHFTAGPG